MTNIYLIGDVNLLTQKLYYMAFKYYNPNPKARVSKTTGEPMKWHLGDCSVRAICGATDMDWVSAYKFASDSALKVFEPFNCTKGFGQVMKDLGFVKISYPKGQPRETVAEFAKNHKGEVAILNVSHHFVCARDGKYLDTWDSGSKTVYNYWVKKRLRL